MRNGAIQLGIALLITSLCGCVVSPEPVGNVVEALQSKDPSLRLRAVIKAGNDGDLDTVCLLIDRLEDPDATVQMFAGIALQKVTGQDMGWRFYEPEYVRKKAVQRWWTWREEQVAERDLLIRPKEDQATPPDTQRRSQP